MATLLPKAQVLHVIHALWRARVYHRFIDDLTEAAAAGWLGIRSSLVDRQRLPTVWDDWGDA